MYPIFVDYFIFLHLFGYIIMPSGTAFIKSRFFFFFYGKDMSKSSARSTNILPSYLKYPYSTYICGNTLPEAVISALLYLY